MGSIVQATPLIRSLRHSFPQARILFLTGMSCRPLVERIDHIDAVLTVDEGSLFRLGRTSLSAVASLAAARVDLYFDLEVYSAYASLIALLSRARNRIGFYRESTGHKRGNYTHLMYFNTRHPIRHIYLQLGRLVGCEPVQPDRLGPVRLRPADRDEAAAILRRNGLGEGPYLVVNPNASDLLLERRWAPERFAQLIGRIIHNFDLPVILIGSPAEQAHVTGLIQSVPSSSSLRVHNLAGKLTLGGLCALLGRAACLVTNDTGPMHFAWALDTPTVCLFGPVDPGHYGWESQDVEIIYKRQYCSPCVHEVDEPPCQGNNVCMKRICVEEVMQAVECILAGRSTRSRDRSCPNSSWTRMPVR